MPLFFNNRRMQNNHMNTFGNPMNNMMRTGFTGMGMNSGYGYMQNMQNMPNGMNRQLGFGQNGMNQPNPQNMPNGMNRQFGFGQNRMNRPNPQNMQNMPNGMNQPNPQNMQNMPNGMNRQIGFGQNGMGYQGQPAFNQTPPQGIPQEPLPDGVKYEPLDAGTLALAQKYRQFDESKVPLEMPSGEIPTSEVPLIKTPHSGMTEPFVGHSNGVLESLSAELEEFLQFERNAGIFYRYLSEVTPALEHKKYLDDISREAEFRGNVYNKIYEGISKKQFKAKDTQIDRSINYRDGIKSAIYEESNKLRELSRFCEKIYDINTTRELNSVICNKIGCLSLLHMINSSLN